MKVVENTQQYVDTVCGQIRWKRAHGCISKELVDHIEDQKRDFVRDGQGEGTAEWNAVREMGDPVIVGQQMDSMYRPKPQWGAVLTMCICIFTGMAIQFITSYCSGLTQSSIYGSLFIEQLKVLPLGIAAFAAIYFIDYTVIVRHARLVYGAMLALSLLLVLSRGTYVMEVAGHTVYIALLMSPAFGAVVYGYRGSGFSGVARLVLLAAVTVAIYAMGGGYMACALFILPVVVIFTLAAFRNWFGIEKKKVMAAVFAPVFAVLIYCMCSDQAKLSLEGRGIYLFSPFRTPNAEYSYLQGIIQDTFLANSKLIGTGVHPFDVQSVQGAVPEIPLWWSSFSLTYLTYRFGYICVALVITVLLVLLVKMVLLTVKQTSELGLMICASVTAVVVLESFLYFTSNLGFVSGMAPPFPFITYGKESLVVNMAMMGLFLSACRNADIVKDWSFQGRRVVKVKSQ